MGKLSDCRLFLLDMDGTLYLDDVLFDGTKQFLRYVKEIGGRYVFLTNNSSRGVEKYVERMKNFGIDAEKSDFVTSTDATVIYLEKPEMRKKYESKKIYAFGTDSFCRQLEDAGLPVVTEPSDDVSILLCGYDTELTYKKLEDACILLNKGVEFIATNPDWVCPTRYGYAPDCGSVCEMLFRATGRRPKFIGKPEPEMALLAMEKFGYGKNETLLVGDRVYTDIACGVNAGIHTAFLLSGEGVVSDIEKYGVHPTYVLDNVRTLLNAMILENG